MPLSALAISLGAAVLHATWNTLLARARDLQAFTALALVIGAFAVAPVAALTWRLDASAIPYVMTGGLLQTAYYALLAAAYRRADMSLVYPLARGLAPVFVLIVGVLLFATRPSGAEIAAVGLVAVGILLVRGFRGNGQRAGTVLATAVALTIAGYTLVDQHGLRYASPFAYLFVELLTPMVVYVGATLRLKGLTPIRDQLGWPVVVAGVLINLTYGLVLVALTMAPAAAVAAVRESGVVFATAMAYFVLHERVGRTRAAGACLVVAGIALLALF